MKVAHRSLVIVGVAVIVGLGVIAAIVGSDHEPGEVLSASAPEVQPGDREPLESLVAAPQSEPDTVARGAESAPTRQVVETAEPAAQPSPVEPRRFLIEGLFVLKELDGTQHSEVDGEFALVVWSGSTGRHLTVPVADGSWSVELVEESAGAYIATNASNAIPFDPDSSGVSASDPSFGTGDVLLDDSSKRYSLVEQPLVIHAHRTRAILLHVEDEHSGLALDGIELVRNTNWITDDNPHPGEVSAGVLVEQDARSPIALDAVAGTAVFYARTPHHAWGRVEVDLSSGSERTVRLVAGGALDVSLVGDYAQAGAKLRLRPEGEKDSRPAVELDVRRRERIAVEGLLPGAYRATVELGDWFREPRALGEGRVDVVARERAAVTIDVQQTEELQKAPLAGIIVVPAEWDIDSHHFSIELQGTPLDGSERHRIVQPRGRVEGRPDAREWTHPDVQTGTYELTFRPLQYSILVDVGPAGASDVVFEIPPPVTLSVLVRDRDSGALLTTGDILWNCKRPEGVSGGGLERVTQRAASGAFEFRVPRGEVTVAYWGDGYEHVSKHVAVTEDATELVLDAPRVYVIEVSYRDGETPIPWPGSADWTVEHLDGTGKLVSTGSSRGKGSYSFDQPGRYLVDLPLVEGYQQPKGVELVVGDGHPGEIVIQLER